MATTMERFHEYAQLPAAEIKKVRFEDWRRNREVEEMLERRNESVCEIGGIEWNRKMLQPA